MKKKLFTPSTLLLLGMLSLFSACNNDDDGTNKPQDVAGKYEGYSIGNCAMFTDYVMGEKSVVTIAPNEDGTINVNYDSGSGEFKLNNIKVTSKTFEGSGQVELSMNDKPAGTKDFTLTGSVDDQKKLTLKVNVPSVMGGLASLSREHYLCHIMFRALTAKKPNYQSASDRLRIRILQTVKSA